MQNLQALRATPPHPFAYSHWGRFPLNTLPPAEPFKIASSPSHISAYTPSCTNSKQCTKIYFKITRNGLVVPKAMKLKEKTLLKRLQKYYILSRQPCKNFWMRSWVLYGKQSNGINIMQWWTIFILKENSHEKRNTTVMTVKSTVFVSCFSTYWKALFYRKFPGERTNP